MAGATRAALAALLVAAVGIQLSAAAADSPGQASQLGATDPQARAAAVRPLPPPAKAAKPKHGPCRPDDARCMGLRDHQCDPYFVNVTDKCTFVRYNKHCAQDVHHIAYLPLFYCRQGDSRVLMSLSFLLWMALLFWVMSKVAEDFLVPALEFLAHWMKLTPDVAGVTLFAFASGAPDLFTQIAAVAVGGNVDQELAISATLGGGLFIVAVIFSMVVLVHRHDGDSGVAEITDRRAFVRDSVVYMLSTLALLGLMLRGSFTAWEAGLLLLGYGAYLATCVLTSKGSGGVRHQYFAAAPSQLNLQQPEQQPGSANGAGLAGAFADEASPLQSPRMQLELVSRVGGPQPQRKPSRAPIEGGSTAASPVRGKLQLSSAAAAAQQQQLGAGGLQDTELSALVAGMPRSNGSPGNGWSAADGSTVAGSPWRVKLSSDTSRAYRTAASGIDELLHTKGKSGPSLWLTLLMSPLMLLLHATMPALHGGVYTMWYGLVLALGAPAFVLCSSGLYPHHVSTQQFFIAWPVSALALFALLFLVPPAGSPGSSAAQLSNGAGGAATGSSPLSAPSSPPLPEDGGSGGGGGSLWARLWSAPAACTVSGMQRRLGARRPRRNVALALLASLQCMLWMSIAADELVALFQAIGRICDISQDLLGATVLAWGEAVPELVATISLAKAGQATMAIAAVFGGPIFNILIAWAGPTLYASLRHGPMSYELSAGVSLLVMFTVIILSFSLIAIPLIFKWRLARKAALCILIIYALSQILFLLAEELL